MVRSYGTYGVPIMSYYDRASNTGSTYGPTHSPSARSSPVTSRNLNQGVANQVDSKIRRMPQLTYKSPVSLPHLKIEKALTSIVEK